MNAKLIEEIQQAQDHVRQKYGNGPDDPTADFVWHEFIRDHNEQADLATPMERREHLVKIAGLACSAVEAFDRKQETEEAVMEAAEQADEFKRLVAERTGCKGDDLQCPRAKSEMAPCVVWNGGMCVTNDGQCVGCGASVEELLVEEQSKHEED